MPVKTYDVLIVGSGHSGGMAANILTSKGISCLMLNAGPEADYEKDRAIKHAYELPYRGFDKPGRLPHVFQANEFNANQWVDEKEVPYTHARPMLRITGCVCGFLAAVRFSGRVNRSASVTSSSKPPKSTARAIAGPSVWKTWRLSILASKGFSVSTGRKEGWPQFPDGDFVEITYPPDTDSIKRFTGDRNKQGVGVRSGAPRSAKMG